MENCVAKFSDGAETPSTSQHQVGVWQNGGVRVSGNDGESDGLQAVDVVEVVADENRVP
jgi:hypothetical protein